MAERTCIVGVDVQEMSRTCQSAINVNAGESWSITPGLPNAEEAKSLE